MTLRQRQSLFATLIAHLIQHLNAKGYEVTFGEFWRPPEMVAMYTADGRGSSTSLHPDRLAADLNLFKDGAWLRETEHHREFGEFWKNLHPDCRWGGDFSGRPDGNHYSMTPDGKRA